MTLIGAAARAPDLVIVGSHCVALDAVLAALAGARHRGAHHRDRQHGRRRGRAARRMRPRADPPDGPGDRHLQRAYANDGLALVRGWQRMQGIVFRQGDPRFAGRTRAGGAGGRARRSGLRHGQPQCRRRHAHPDRSAARCARPAGYGNQPRSHNAVAAAVAQGRADWGVAIQPVAAMYGLGFLQLSPENYDFLLVEARRARPAVAAFLSGAGGPAVRAQIAALGMMPARAIMAP